ncbi:MAG: tetratricopeptide repeat protein [Crocinitomicaceae bacterium]|nr:tetratricopeptide repeat protein [Crocinitomicaceae bacterium]
MSISRFTSFLLFYTTILAYAQPNESGGSVESQISALMNEGALLNEQGEFDRAEAKFNEVLTLAITNDNIPQVINALINLGHAYFNQSKNEEALYAYMKAMVIAEQDGTPTQIGTLHNSIGNVYFKQGLMDNALEHYLLSIEIRTNSNNIKGLSSCYNGIGAIYVKKEDYDKAENYFIKSLEYKIAFLDSTGIASSNKNLGSVYYKQGKYDLALMKYMNSLSIEKRLDIKSKMPSSYYNIGITYYAMDMYDPAIAYIDSSLSIAEEIGYTKGILQANQALSEVYENMNNKDKALSYYKQYVKVKDSIQLTRNQDALVAIETKYEIERAKQETQLLNHQVKIKSLELSRNKNILIATITTFSLLLLMAYLFYRNKRLSSKKKLVELDQQLLRAQINPHFLFNSLNSIQNYFLNNESKKANKYLSEFSILMRQILDSSSTTMHSIQEELDFTKRYLNLEQARLVDKFDYEIEVDEKMDVTNTLIPALIFQPFVENSIWHGISPLNSRGLVELQLIKEQDEIKCIIKDNGIGFKQSKKSFHESKGLKITEDRVKNMYSSRPKDLKLNISTIIKDGDVKGTIVSFSIPIEYKKLRNEKK